MSAERITPALLRDWPLPREQGGDKESRGRVLVVAGMRTIPGAAILAANAALRAGAGKLQVATPASVAVNIAISLPEALVVPFDEDEDGAPSLESVAAVSKYAREADAVVLGPGMAPNDACTKFVCNLLARFSAPVILDASALFAVKRDPKVLKRFGGAAVLTPHAAELSDLIDEPVEAIRRDPHRYALEQAKQLGAVVALKGAKTYIADQNGRTLVNERGHIGLATSGSGDVLAGMIGGLLARGATPLQASAFGVSLHAMAGEALGQSVGLGFLAREILAEIPRQMRTLVTS